jgi:hypothetical protein
MAARPRRAPLGEDGGFRLTDTVLHDITGQHPIGGICILYTPWGSRIRFAFTR